MTRAEIISLVTLATAAYPTSQAKDPEPIVNAWALMLTDIPFAVGKAAMVNLVGAGDGLSAERSYMLKTLPSGVFQGVRDALVRRDLTGLGRSTAIVAGLTVTSVSYVYGRLALRLAERGKTDNAVNLSSEQS